MTTVTYQPAADTIDFLGNPARILVSGQTARGAYCLVESSGPRGDMPPLHRHHADDEAFYVLDGRLTIFVGDRAVDLPAGACAFAPRGVAHTYRVESESARWLVLASPAGFDTFVREVAEAGSCVGPGELAEIARRHGIELLGPPGALLAES